VPVEFGEAPYFTRLLGEYLEDDEYQWLQLLWRWSPKPTHSSATMLLFRPGTTTTLRAFVDR